MRLLILFLFMCLANTGCSQDISASATTNSSWNLDMEQLDTNTGRPIGWGRGNGQKINTDNITVYPEIIADPEIKKQGRYSIRLDPTLAGTGKANCKYKIHHIFKGHKIKLTGWIKSENAGNSFFWLRVDGENGPLSFGNMRETPVTGTTDWTQYSIEIDYNDALATGISLGAMTFGNGKIWIDDLQLHVDGKRITEQGAIGTGNEYNLGMERLVEGRPQNWGLNNIYNAEIPKGNELQAFITDSLEKKEGKYALCINWKQEYGEWTAVNYAVNKVFAGKKIALSGWVKTEGTDSGAGLWMRIDGERETLAFDNMQDRLVRGTTGWQQYHIELDYNRQKAKRIVVGGLIYGNGKLWIDDLQITIDGQDITKTKLLSDTKTDLSGIVTIDASPQKLKALTNLGMLWGFIKYYHPAVASGNFDMDEQLFSVLPRVLAASDNGMANSVLEKWVDSFGVPARWNGTRTSAKKITLQPDYGDLFDKGNLSESLRQKLVYIQNNRQEEKNPQYGIKVDQVGFRIFNNERDYDATTYPDAGIRLLALYRYWNMVQYFFPYRHLIGEDWNKVLTEFIPSFCAAANDSEYHILCLKLVVRIHDTHAQASSEILIGLHRTVPPFYSRFIGDKLVVAGYYQDSSEIINSVLPGDVITEINGETTESLVKKYLPLTPGSNYQAQLRDIPKSMGFLFAGGGSSINLTIKRSGKTHNLSVRRIMIDSTVINIDYMPKKQKGCTIKNNIGYLYPATLQNSDSETIKTAVMHTKGIIFDMRGYPTIQMPFTYGKWLKKEETPFAIFSRPNPNMPGQFYMEAPVMNGGGDSIYKGKIVIIVNSETQSSGEYQTMALASTPGAITIGSTSSGADGNVCIINLPGGIRTAFSGLGVLYPDGTETQRKGIKINRVITPTVKGIKENRDELMEAAITIIEKEYCVCTTPSLFSFSSPPPIHPYSH